MVALALFFAPKLPGSLVTLGPKWDNLEEVTDTCSLVRVVQVTSLYLHQKKPAQAEVGQKASATSIK